MLKPAMIAAFGLTAVALSFNDPAPTAAPTGPCEVSSRGEAMLWGRAHPGESHVQACKALSGT